ncbi:hypothetical protein JST99_02685 [Candidatus Dependentiae bacterium]|nr:hypothetical protein [Candidatus Dependentiae bacterium]MCC7415189.1 hypothetical protein [Campylobacterota bacterium]
MKRYMHYLYLLVLWLSHTIAYDAYVIVPVADLVGEPLASPTSYTTIPLSGDQTICRRLHQLLYHDRVRVLEIRNKQAHIELPTVFYKTHGSNKRESTFWTAQAYLLPADEIQGDLHQLPLQASYQTWQAKRNNEQPIVTLAHPYHDHLHDIRFSAGTQFVRVPANDKTQDRIKVYLLDPATKRIRYTHLPANLCLTTNSQNSPQTCINLFIHLIRSWITNASPTGHIPYVWGGTSVGSPTKGSIKRCSKKKGASWYESARNRQSTQTGCDCSGLIMRAAQIAGIPYFFKNSYTATCYLKAVGPTQPLAQGDIIWVPGHVMIVADMSKNSLFEARSHDHGYGKLQEIALGDVFKGIPTYQALLHAYEKKIPLERIDKAGVVKDHFPSFKLLSLASAWDNLYTR